METARQAWVRAWTIVKTYWLALSVVVGSVVLIAVGMHLSLQIQNQVTETAAQLAQVENTRERLTAWRDLTQYQVESQIKIWSTLAQIAGAFVLGVGGYFAWKNLQVGQANLRATNEKLEIERSGQITTRFTQAIEQLGAVRGDDSPSMELRLGGIYALERILRESSDEHWAIIEILTSYVRGNAPALGKEGPTDGGQPPLPPRADVQAALKAIARRPRSADRREPVRINLSMIDLRGADLRDAFLAAADLRKTDLRRAELTGADLSETWFSQSRLDLAVLEHANCTGASFISASLANASLVNSTLTRAQFRDADLAGAELDSAVVERANFIAALGLTAMQVRLAANGGQDAILSSDLKSELQWTEKLLKSAWQQDDVVPPGQGPEA